MTKRNNVGRPEDGEGDELLDKLYVAQWLGISVGMVDELRRQKKLRAVKVGKYVRFRRSEVLRYLKSVEEGGDGDGAGAVKSGGKRPGPGSGRGGRRERKGAK